jgi:hypothetical protein
MIEIWQFKKKYYFCTLLKLSLAQLVQNIPITSGGRVE